MSTITQAAQQASVSDGDCYPPYRMSIDQYEKLVGSGVFTKRDKLQLINGRLVAKMTINPPHAVATDLCRDALILAVPPGWCVRSEKPVRLPPNSAPEPDQCVVRGELTDYVERHPSANDVGLLIEIADASLVDDRKMARTYGPSGIRVYWIVNLVDRQIDVHNSPTADGYDGMQVYKSGERVPIMLDEIVVGFIAVSDILP
jgi:Uma2 family endonuclease